MSTVTDSNKKVVLIDARGPRYSAGITTTVLALALITESNYLIGFQFVVFLSAVIFGLRRSLYGLVYRKLIQPDRKSTRLNSSHVSESRMPSSA